MPITKMILSVSESDPSRVAIAENGRNITYGQLPALSKQIAVLSSTLTTETPVFAIVSETAFDAALLVAAAANFDSVTLVLDHNWPLEHLSRAVKTSGANILVSDNQDLLGELKKAEWDGSVLGVRELWEKASLVGLADADSIQLVPERDGSEPFLLIFTSGTTDLPKGFYRTRKSWRHNLNVSRQSLFAFPGINTIAPGPLAYSLTLYALIEVLGTGGTIYLQSTFDPIAAVQTIDAEDIERIVAVPAVLPMLEVAARRSALKLTSLKYAVTGGAALSAKLRDRFQEVAPRADILSYYGAAEIGFIGYTLKGSEDPLVLFEGVLVQIRGESNRVVPEGDLGQIYVRVASQGDRYIQTTGGEQITGSDGWSTVGDAGRMLAGRLQLEGRLGDIAVTGGHKVSLQQVDMALAAIPGCENSVSVAIPDAELGERVVAVIETGTRPDKLRVLGALRATLAPQFVPRRIYVTEKLPRTVGGKIRRKETRESLLQNRFERL